MTGCVRRLHRFFHPVSKRCVLLPLDCGRNDGLINDVEQLPTLMDKLQTLPGGFPVDGVVAPKGVARAFGYLLSPEDRLIIHLSAGTRHGLPSYNKSLVCTVPEALRLGADAVSVQVSIGNDLEDRMIADLGVVTDEAHQYGLPVLAIIQASGEQIVNETDPMLVSDCIRLGGELGADMVCAVYSGDQTSFGEAVASCPAPVLAAFDSRRQDKNFLKTVKEALDAGISGVLAGRTWLQSADPLKNLDDLLTLVHKS